MTQTALDISGPEGKLSRTAIGLRRLGDAWKGQLRGDRFLESLLAFLGSATRNTRKSYSFAVLEFWSWYEMKRGFVPTPDKVRRADAFAYADWLREHELGLDEQRLQSDPDRDIDVAIYRFVLERPASRFTAIRKHLLSLRRFSVPVRVVSGGVAHTVDVLDIERDVPRGDELEAYVEQHGRPPPSPLDIRLACLVEHKLLRRSPTVAEIRSGQAPVDEEFPHRAQIEYRVDPDVFSYFIDVHTEASGVERVSTVAQRLSALSSFWNFLANTGENVAAESEQLLQHNVWTAPLRTANRLLPARRAVARALTTPSLELFTRILATTFTRSHDDPYGAAAAAIDGVDAAETATGDASTYDLRDRAVLLFAVLVGARAEEITLVRRSDITSSAPHLVTITGKGDKQRLVRLPAAVLRCLVEFWARLDDLAAVAKPFARVQALTMRTAPLFPALKLWGRNERELERPEEMRGLGRSALGMMMRRRAMLAGVSEDSDEIRRVHPHGLRHLAALLATDRGVDARTIQATLGHTSLATTGIYVEERDPARRSLVPERERRAPVKIVEQPPWAAAEQPEDGDKPETFASEEDESETFAPEEGPFVSEEGAERPEDGDKPETFASEEDESETIEAPLTGYGEPPDEPVYLPSDQALLLAEEAESVSFLLRTYKDHWGETGRRQMFATGAGASGVLAQAYVGKRSGLGWWQGMAGRLKDPEFSYVPNPDFPSMPVISPAQFIGTSPEPTCDQPLCLGLIELSNRWSDDEERGPTAVAALADWIRAAAIVTREVEEVLIDRRGAWVAFEAPLDETRADPSVSPRTLREHLDGAVIAWFEAVGWQSRPLAARGMPSGAAFEIPSWYAETDPLASLPSQERTELFDWLRVFVGLPPRDRTARFADGLSRRDVGDFMSAVCQYEMIRGDDDLNMMGGLDRRTRQHSLQVLNEQIRTTAHRLTRGRVNNFDYHALRTERKVDRTRQQMAREAAARGGEEQERTEQLRSMYSKYLGPYILDVAGGLFGEEVARDPILELFAYCVSGAPLAAAGDKYKQLFRIVGDTISHTPEYAREFAQETGQHSECVARRLARQLYEAGSPAAWAKRRNWPEAIASLDAMAAYRVPCPRTQEAELAQRLSIVSGRVPVFEEWKRARRTVMSAAEPEEGPAWMTVYEEEVERAPARPKRPAGHFEQNPRALSHERVDRARAFLPNEALVALWNARMVR